MTKLKSASDWMGELKDILYEKNPKNIALEYLIRIIQQNAIEAALEVAANDAKSEIQIEFIGINPIQKSVVISKSITSLINHKDLKL